jgi:hypothetical protein
LDAQVPNIIDGIKNIWVAPSRAMTDSPEDVGKRITELWTALGYETSAAFAAALGVSPQRVNNVEVGMSLSRDLAIKIVKFAPGLTLDWLYFGKPDGLPLELARLLGAFGTARSGKTSAR